MTKQEVLEACIEINDIDLFNLCKILDYINENSSSLHSTV